MEILPTLSDLFECYQTFQISHPHLGAMVTAEAVYVGGDLVSQLMHERKVDGRKLKYTAALAPIYGLCLEGLIESGELVGRYISENPLTKAALGPNFLGNFFNTFFFVNNAVGEREGYRIRNLVHHYVDLFSPKPSEKGLVKRICGSFNEKYISHIPHKEMLYATVSTLTLWNAFQYVNYSYIKEDMRTPVTLAAAFVWICALSLWSLRGRKNC